MQNLKPNFCLNIYSQAGQRGWWWAEKVGMCVFACHRIHRRRRGYSVSEPYSWSEASGEPEGPSDVCEALLWN